MNDTARWMRAAAGATLALAAFGCGCSGPSEAAPPTTRLESVDGRVLTASTRFGLKLYADVMARDAGKNIMLSPPSVSLALSMAYNGAQGETRTAMAKTLGIDAMTLDEANQANAALIAALQGMDPKVKLTIANSLWARQGVPFVPDFVERCRRFYNAEATTLDFNDPAAPARINDWVSRSTNGKIPTIVDKITPEMILYLINAIYFKGNWSKQFDPKNTHGGTFTLTNGNPITVPMMSQSGRYRYLEDPSFQAVSLPYGDGMASMYLFLPRGQSLAQFQAGLAANWDGWMGRFHTMQGDIALPRYKFGYELGLNDPLKALGMGIAFDPNRADLSGITTAAQAYISEAKHKTFIEVNEEGTEAAAVTSIGVGVTSMPLTFRMTLDHPFFFAIRHDATGTILFMGVVEDPRG